MGLELYGKVCDVRPCLQRFFSLLPRSEHGDVEQLLCRCSNLNHLHQTQASMLTRALEKDPPSSSTTTLPFLSSTPFAAMACDPTLTPFLFLSRPLLLHLPSIGRQIHSQVILSGFATHPTVLSSCVV
ncbi:hypothetical protein V8G54_018585 [Vigna mungo]|uniref:Uncharacterized protein n=1 Tax=Vigna mungo TaxID=3915 RepID=A0AAQ3RUR8_VIGMU